MIGSSSPRLLPRSTASAGAILFLLSLSTALSTHVGASSDVALHEDPASNVVEGGHEGDIDVGVGAEGAEHKTGVFFLTYVLLSLACVVLAAVAAGLTMGLLSLDPLQLEIKRRASTDAAEREQCASLLPLLLGHSQRHRLLVSLLLLTSMANEALPLFLDEILPGKLASVLVGVTLVLFFGEIVPSAVFTGPDQVKLAARLVPLVKSIMAILAPVATPIAWLLDWALHDDEDGVGHTGGEPPTTQVDVTEGNFYNRLELSAMVRIQYEAQLAAKRRQKMEQVVAAWKSPSSDLEAAASSSRISNATTQSMHADEITIMEGALTMTTKVAADVLTPLRKVYALPKSTVLDEPTVVDIWARGYSRVPVYLDNSDAHTNQKSAICGVLLTRQLIVISPSDERKLETLPLQLPPCVPPSMNLVNLTNLFQSGGGRGGGGSHLAIVCARPTLAEDALRRGEAIPEEAKVIGIVALEDVVEELLQEEIYDESDRRSEDKLVRSTVRKWKSFVKRKNGKKSETTTVPTASTIEKEDVRVESMSEKSPLLR